MKLNAGANIGPYEILTPIGAGGMGEVYRARDVRLQREVALKILLPSATQDEDARRRFEREARAASALNHPNIVTIYDLGAEAGIFYIAMELVEGRTLRDAGASGALATKALLNVAVQIADALAAAHERGIVHRDLKPENIIVTGDGRVKILDFGLAKDRLAGPADGIGPTMTETSVGVVVGTAGYMSPEQARGLPVDFRSDQFSFGAVIYELATGRRAFLRGSAIETAAAVITDPVPPLDSSCPDMPLPMRWAVERCLSKNAADRYGSTRELHEELRAVFERLSDVRYEGASASSPNLPTPRTPFVGRQREAAAVAALVMRDEVRWVTLTGPGGVGKTRLGLQVARMLGERLAVWFIPLAATIDALLVPSAIAQAVGADTAGRSTIDAITSRLRALRAPLLLIIDNFEQVSDAVPVLTKILEACANVKVLVTSRALLHVYGEYEFPVPPLALPDRHAAGRIDTLAACASVELFVDRATAAKPSFTLTAENAPAVAAICTRLDGLPMAIELAAARIKMLSPAALLARLEGRLLSLAGGARDLPARQQTIRAAIDWSHDLLTPAEQILFRRLGVFVGGWTLEAAEAVCNAREDLDLDLFDGLSSLVDKSLVQRAESPGEEGRFEMLETIREYALERLNAGSDLEVARRAHAAYCLILAEESAAARDAAEHSAWLSRCDEEHANFRAALDYARDKSDAEWGLRLGCALLQFWQTRGHLIEGREQLSRLLQLPATATRPELRARALFALATIAHSQRDSVAALACHEEALSIYRAVGDRKGIAISTNAFGIIKGDLGDHQAARSYFEEAVALWRDIGDEPATARTLSNLAGALKAEGDLPRALSLYQECRDTFRRAGDEAGLSWSLVHEGDCAREQQDVAGAKALYEDALARFRVMGDAWGIGTALMSLGHAAFDVQDLAAAGRLYEEALTTFWRLGDPRGTVRLVEALACLAAAKRDAVRALKLAGAASASRHLLQAPALAAERTLLEQRLAPMRQAVDATAATSAWMEGWTMSLEDAVTYALDQRV